MHRYDILAMSVVDCPLCESKAGSKCICLTPNRKNTGVEMLMVHLERRYATQSWRKEHPDEYKEKLKELTPDRKKHTRTKHSAQAFERE